MKNFSYLIILLFSITLVGCGDINEFTPTVQDPNAEWKLLYNKSSLTPITTPASLSEKFTYTINKSTNRITITHHFIDDRRVWFTNQPKEVKLTNTTVGPQIEITYHQESYSTNSSVVSDALFQWEHEFSFSQIGRGAGAKIPVLIRRTYKDVNLFGFDKVDPLRYIE
jgi:uncharacterized lipoprotein YehR (DUF1307 family)